MTKPIKSSVESPWFYTRKLKRFYMYKSFIPIVNLKFFYRNFYRKCNLCLKSPWSRLKIVYLTVRILLCVFDCEYLTVCIWQCVFEYMLVLSEPSLWICLKVKELLRRNKRDICNLNDYIGNSKKPT